MQELCINCEHPLEIGKIEIGECLNENWEYTPIAIKIIRTVTVNEYIAFVKKHKLENRIKRNINDKFLYLVEVLD